jgi:hypothetical protein
MMEGIRKVRREGVEQIHVASKAVLTQMSGGGPFVLTRSATAWAADNDAGFLSSSEADRHKSAILVTLTTTPRRAATFCNDSATPPAILELSHSNSS